MKSLKNEQEIISKNKQKIKEKTKTMTDYIISCFDIQRLIPILEILDENELFNIEIDDIKFEFMKDNYNFIIKSDNIVLKTTRYGKIVCNEINSLTDYIDLLSIYQTLKENEDVVYRKIKEQLDIIIKEESKILDY